MRLYRALLHLFPRSFRAEYGGEMQKDFAREWHTAHGAGALALLITAAIDIAGNACRVHLDILKHDVKHAMRSLRRSPGFTLTSIVVAAIGIGATTATFTLADHVLIRALPFPNSHELVKVWEDRSSRGYPRLEPSPPNFRDWQRQATVFDRLEAFYGTGGAMIGHGEARRLNGAVVTPGLMTMLGRQAALGRILTESDATAPDGEQPIVISDRFWRASFAASPEALGNKIILDDVTYVIVGVMPADFFFPSRDADMWRLLLFSSANGDDDRDNHMLEVIGRLKPGVSVNAALSEMQAIGADLARKYPKNLEGTSVTLVRWRDVVAWQPRMMLLGLVGASLCVLLIACVNLANLLMSRALARRNEFAIKAAVGASIDRLVRQMLTDSLLLALCGGVLGVVLAIASLPLLVRLVPTALPISEVPPIDIRMLAGALLLTTATGLAFGLLPALRVCKSNDAAALKDGARGGSSRSTERLRSSLVVAEIVASVVLVVCVGLLTQALLAVQRVDPGFRADHLLTLRTQLPINKYAPTPARVQFYSRVLNDVQALPGVTSASYISWLPMTMRGGIWDVLSPTRDAGSPGGFLPLESGKTSSASIRFVTPRFFETVGTPILKGRDVSDSDTLESPLVAVVSESFAKQHFPNEDPIGRQFAIAFDARTIVGVVGDIKVRGLERVSEPQVYMPASQQRVLFFYAPKDLVIRSTVPPTTLVPAVRSIIAGLEPDMPITAVQTMEQLVAAETAPRLVQLRVLGGFAAVAFLLAAIGIHGLLSFTVSSRSREIGVRMALGAGSGDIMRMVMTRSLLLAVAGVVIGSAVAYAAGRSMQALLFGIDPADAGTFTAAIGLSMVMTIAGSLLPAWRAIKVDPITATRTD